MRANLYLLLCLLVPALWGLLVAWVYDLVDARRRAAAPPQGRPDGEDEQVPMYHI